jgi:hypothetical protein
MDNEVKQKMIEALIEDRFECICDDPRDWEFFIKLGLHYQMEKWTDDEIAEEFSYIEPTE